MNKFFVTPLFVLALFHSSANAENSELPNIDCSSARQKYEDAYKQYSQAVVAAQTQQKQQAEEYSKQMAIVKSQAAQQQEMIEKGKALLAKQEESMTKQAAHQERFGKVLDVWEKQQEQYQQYLNSLTPGK